LKRDKKLNQKRHIPRCTEGGEAEREKESCEGKRGGEAKEGLRKRWSKVEAIANGNW